MIDKISAVIFDMDGLLLDTERLYFDAYKSARITLGMPAFDQGFIELVGLNPTSSAAILERRLDGLVEKDKFDREWDKAIKDLMAEDIPLKPGVLALLDQLQQIQMPYAIATSTPTDRAWAHLEKAGIAARFDLIIGGDQVARGKPAPDIYLAAADQVGVAPKDCAAFEDSENGTKAAVAAGLRTVQIPDIVPPSKELLSLGHHVAPDLISGAQHLGLMP